MDGRDDVRDTGCANPFGGEEYPFGGDAGELAEYALWRWSSSHATGVRLFPLRILMGVPRPDGGALRAGG